MTNMKNSIVFQPSHIGTLKIKNRLVRSATFENAASGKGEATEELLQIYRSLAEGGVGLIITGIGGVYTQAIMPNQVRFDEDRFIPKLKKIPDVVHEINNDCRIMVQLNHPGRQVADPENPEAFISHASPALLTVIEKQLQETVGEQEVHPKIEPTAPSAIFDKFFQRTPRALTVEEIEKIIDAFSNAIRRAMEAGFDGVQLHAAHGWLLSSFLSPYTNHREDAYGGSTENRAKILTEIYKRSRKMVGDDFPITVKFNTTDFLPGGIDTEEAINLSRILSKTGYAALETSGGMWETVTLSESELGWPPVLIPESRTNIKSKDEEGYFATNASAIKNNTDATVILVGGIKSFDKIEEILNNGIADFVSMSRPLIRQPDLPNLWLTGKGPSTAECISCNACLPIGGSLGCRMKKADK